MPRTRPIAQKKRKPARSARIFRRLSKPSPKLSGNTRLAAIEVTELKQCEASFRVLFDSNPVPMIVCALDGEHILSVNDAAIEHYGYSRAEFQKLTIRSLQAFDSDAPWAAQLS